MYVFGKKIKKDKLYDQQLETTIESFKMFRTTYNKLKQFVQQYNAMPHIKLFLSWLAEDSVNNKEIK
jgi:hypothetical protein